jgi:hypothetical protein
MKWIQVDKALEFLEQSGDTILLQVPYMADEPLVVRYIIDKLRPLKFVWTRSRGWLEFGGFVIRFEILSSTARVDMAGQGWNCPMFLIERDHDPVIPFVEV